MSASTVRRRLIAVVQNGRCAARITLLRPSNKRKWIIWAKKTSNWTIDQLKRILWTDEFKFGMFGSRRWVYVGWITSGRMIITCAVSTVKHGGGNMMTWDCFVRSTVGDIYLEYWINIDITLYYSDTPFCLGHGWSVTDLCVCKKMTRCIPLSYVISICRRKLNKISWLLWNGHLSHLTATP